MFEPRLQKAGNLWSRSTCYVLRSLPVFYHLFCVLLSALLCPQVSAGSRVIVTLCRALNALPLSSQNTSVPSHPVTNPNISSRSALASPLSLISLTSSSQTPPVRKVCRTIQAQTLRFFGWPSHSYGPSVRRSSCCSRDWTPRQS